MKRKRILTVAMMSLTAAASSAFGQGATCETAQPLVNSTPISGTGWFSYTNDACGQDVSFGAVVAVGTPSIEVLDVCGGTRIASDNGSGTSASVTVALAQGQTVFVRIGGTGVGGALSALPEGEADSDGDGVPDCLDNCPNDPNVINTSTGEVFPTIAAAISAASSGDTLEIGPCIFFERGLVQSKTITIRGAGTNLTVIDGAGVPGSIFNINGGAVVTIERVRISNGVAQGNNAGGALFAGGSRVTFRDCVLSGHDSGGGIVGAVYSQNTQLTFERCVFTDNVSTREGTAVPHAFLIGGSLKAVDCLFAGGVAVGPGPGRGILYQDNSPAAVDVRLVNCTFAGLENATHHLRVDNGAAVEVVGCVFDSTAAVLSYGGTRLTSIANVFVGATGDNIDAEPIFVDAANGDFRLAAGSPGIDFADATAYLDAGGGLFDLAGGARFNNDAGLPDTGSGPFLFLDAGAFEFQDNTPNPIDADFNNDGNVDNVDIIDLADLIDAAGG